VRVESTLLWYMSKNLVLPWFNICKKKKKKKNYVKMLQCYLVICPKYSMLTLVNTMVHKLNAP